VLLVCLYLVNAAFTALFFTRIRFRLPHDFLLIGFAAMALAGWLCPAQAATTDTLAKRRPASLED
jgi:hypothetical protein